ncbi:hypothetical protein D0T21_09555 [Duganella sp. BJB476]|nr:hypothetical protein D0T21_09555 [Duganella sp. BJB476]
MGAFCVFGISRTVCKAAAARKVPTHEGKRNLTLEEWTGRRDALAEQMYADSTRRVKISPELDTPHFCRDWLLTDPGHVRDAVVMVRGPKRDKNGEVIVKDGAPVETWLEYSAECARLGIEVASCHP